VFHDGSCPLCAFEIGHLRKLRAAARIAWIDIASRESQPDWLPDTPFDAAVLGKRPQDLSGAMHAWDVSERRFYVGTDAFRRIYPALGLGWVWGWTAHPAVRGSVDAAYAWFAANRHRFLPRKAEWHGHHHREG
jgi:predicted DCC family thiol-disulfide oxidoreductase YuxK